MMERLRHATFSFCITLLLLFILCGFSEAAMPERRRPQFQKESGYYIIPTPYSLPGIGQGLALGAVVTNISNTYTDAYGFALTGDLSGFGGAVADIHLIPETLILDLNAENLSRARVTNYSQRGMKSEKDDFTLLDIGDINFYGARLTSTFFNRRLEIYQAPGLRGFATIAERPSLRQRILNRGVLRLMFWGHALILQMIIQTPERGFGWT